MIEIAQDPINRILRPDWNGVFSRAVPLRAFDVRCLSSRVLRRVAVGA